MSTKKQCITIAFFKAFDDNNKEATLLSKCIAWYTKGVFSHTAVLFTNDIGIVEQWEASPSKHKVIVTEHIPDNDKWVYTTIEVNDLERIKKFLESIKGLKYDFAGILGFLLPTKDRSDSWFCSEVAANCLKIDGNEVFWRIEPSSISPNKLARMLGVTT